MKNKHWAQNRKINKKKEERSNFFRVVYWFLFLVFVCTVIYIFVFSNFMKVSEIRFSGNEDIKDEIIHDELRNRIDGHFLWIFPKNNYFFISKNGIRKDLMEKFKKIESVEVIKQFPEFVDVKIKERDFLLLWCTSDECFMMDRDGEIFANVDFNSDEIKENELIKITDLSSRSVNMKEKILTKEYVDFVIEIENLIRENSGLEIENEYKTSSRVADELIVRTTEGWEIYFDTRNSIEDSIRMLRAFLVKHIEGNEIRDDLEYVDLRTGHKVYYKIKRNEEEEGDGENEIEDEAE